jgi:hypothetical protein
MGLFAGEIGLFTLLMGLSDPFSRGVYPTGEIGLFTEEIGLSTGEIGLFTLLIGLLPY